MYAGIFEDVEKVKKHLISHGYKAADEILIFELLEDYKGPDPVIQVLMSLSNNTSDLRGYCDEADTSYDSKDTSCSSNSAHELIVENPVLVRETFPVVNDLADNTQEELDVCALKDNANRKARSDDSNEVTAILGDNEISKLIESMRESTSSQSISAFVNLTYVLARESNGRSKDKEILDLTNSTNDSETEVDDYFQDLCFSQESDDGHRICSPPLLSPSQLCGATSLPNSDNQIQDVTTPEVMEILEENNNDPNNNLDDIENLVENPALNAVPNVVSVDAVKEDSWSNPDNPRPGCSKDPYYTRLPLNDGYKVLDEVYTIKSLLPEYKFYSILSALRANQYAANRMELTLWDLLPDKRPVAILCTKRKLNCDISSVSPKKSYVSLESSEISRESNTSNKTLEESVNQSGQGSSSTKTISTAENKVPLLGQSFAASSLIPPANTSSAVPILGKYILPTLDVPPFKNCDENTCYTDNNALSNLQKSVGYSDQDTLDSKGIDIVRSTVKPDCSGQLFIGSTLLSRFNVSKDSTIPTVSSKCIIAEPTLIVGSNNSNEETKKASASGKEQASYIFDRRSNEEMPMATDCATSFDKRETNETVDNTSLRKSSLQECTQSSDFMPRDIIKSAKLILQKRSLVNTVPTAERIEKKSLLAPAKLTLNHAKVYKILEKFAQPSSSTTTICESTKVCRSIVPGTSNTMNWQALPEHLKPLGAKCEFKDDFPLTVTAPQEGSVRKTEEMFRLVNKPSELSNDMNSNVDKYKSNTSEPVPIQVSVPSTSTNTAATLGLNRRSNAEDNEINSSVALPKISNASSSKLSNDRMTTVVNKGTNERLPNPNDYYVLRNMFPYVDSLYIRNVCVDGVKYGYKTETLVDTLLEHGEKHPRITQASTPEPTEYNLDEQYENLLAIFPDADPNYLRGFAEQNYDKPEVIKTFVQLKLEKRDYPTKEQYLKKIKITEQQRQYTTGFDIKQFLEIFPDPVAYFEDVNRMSTYDAVAYEFLKSHFSKNKVNTISRMYSKCNYNLSLTARNIDLMGPDMKSKRIGSAMPTENIPLLQEFAFVRNRCNILSYMSVSKDNEEKEFQELKARKELLECQCCFDTECMPSKCSNCSEGHVFCNSCIITGTESRMGDGQTHFPCFVDCNGEFTLLTLQRVLKPTKFSILLQKRQEAEVMAAGLEGLISCPFCHFASIPPAEDKVFKCFNPECMKESCRLCRELNHVPLRCNEIIKSEEARHYLEEKMTQALVRTCYRCHRPFFKEEGCNKMTCPCGALMCYICGKPVKGYNHFNGQGSERTDLCPLWSDDRRMNAETVLVVARATQKELLTKNPNIKINAQPLMPILPPKSKGPHNDIRNANVLPDRVYGAGGAIP